MAKRTTKKQQPGEMAVADPPSGAGSGSESGDATATRAWKYWRETRSHLEEWRKEALECYDFVAGKQYTDEEEAALKAAMRPIVVFNRTGVVVDAVSGYEINGRQDVTYLPRENADTGPAQVVSGGARYYREECDAEDEESDAFGDMISSGYGWTEHRMDYDDDPEGMLKVERVDPMEMGYDRSSRKRNLLDRRWDIRGKAWDKEVAKAKFPEADFETGTIWGDVEFDENTRPVDREAAAFYASNSTGQQLDEREGKVFILELTWFKNEPFVTYLDPMTGKAVDTDVDEFDAISKRLETVAIGVGQQPMSIKHVRRTRKKFFRAFVHGRTTIEEGDAPCPHRFHYQCMTGKRDRNKNIFYGIVRSMRDPQRWANKWLSQSMHMLNTNAKNGLLHEAGAFDNVAEVERSMAKPGFRLQVNDGYLEKVKIVEPAPLPNDTFNLMQFAVSSIRDSTGVNVELLGMADRDQPGVLENARKQSAMAILAPFFNSMRRYRKEAGRLTLYFVDEYLSDDRMVRIVSKGERKYVPLTKQDDFAKYDVIVDEAPTSPNAKEAVFGVIAQLMPTMEKMGIRPPPSVLDYIPGMPAELAEEWKQSLQPTPESQKAQHIAEEEKKADINATNAKALLDEAKATGELGKVIGMMQQALTALGLLQIAIPGGSEPAASGMPQPGPMMPPPEGMMPPQSPEMPIPAPNGAPPMVPNA